MKMTEAFKQGTNQGKAIVSCLDKVYRPSDLNLKWLSETAVISDAVMDAKEYKGQWTVDEDCSKDTSHSDKEELLMEAIKKHLESRLKHATKRKNEVMEAHGDTPSKTHSYHGGWSFGYWEGKEAAYQDLLDKLEAEGVDSNE